MVDVSRWGIVYDSRWWSMVWWSRTGWLRLRASQGVVDIKFVGKNSNHLGKFWDENNKILEK